MSVNQAGSDKCPRPTGLTRSIRQTRSVKQTAMLPARQTKVSANQGKSAGMLITVGKAVQAVVGTEAHMAAEKRVTQDRHLKVLARQVSFERCVCVLVT